jgi:hypothetical protein
VTHPHNLAAVVAWWALLESEQWIRPTILAEAESGRTGRPARLRSPAALRRLGVLAAAARAELAADRIAAGRAGLTDTAKGLGNTPAPIRPELLDAQSVNGLACMDLLQLIGEAASDRLDNAIDPRTVVDLRTLAIPDAIRELDQWRALEAGRALSHADQVVRDAVRVGPSQEPYEGMCPACGAYGLVWETAAADPAEWTVLCAYGCRCEGEPCGCGLPVRVAGADHRWEPAIIAPTCTGALRFEQVIVAMQEAAA